MKKCNLNIIIKKEDIKKYQNEILDIFYDCEAIPTKIKKVKDKGFYVYTLKVSKETIKRYKLLEHILGEYWININFEYDKNLKSNIIIVCRVTRSLYDKDFELINIDENETRGE